MFNFIQRLLNIFPVIVPIRFILISLTVTERFLSHLVSSLNGCSSQGCTRLNPGVWSFSESPTWVQAPNYMGHLPLLRQAHQHGAGLEVGHLELAPAPQLVLCQQVFCQVVICTDIKIFLYLNKLGIFILRNKFQLNEYQISTMKLENITQISPPPPPPHTNLNRFIENMPHWWTGRLALR